MSNKPRLPQKDAVLKLRKNFEDRKTSIKPSKELIETLTKKLGPKILVIDIETSPIISYTWGLFDQNVGLNQIKEDWTILAFAAKWLDSDKMIYADVRSESNIRNDKALLDKMWKLLDESDIIVTQNGKRFDIKKINARFILNGMKPPSSYKQIDTLVLAKKYFGFTSNKLEYMADKINKKYKKLKHDTFSGFELWKECLNGNLKAWKEMEKYNKHDVLSLQELYMRLIPWDNAINFNVYHPGTATVCTCGSHDFVKNGYAYGKSARYQRFQCKDCGSEIRSKANTLSEYKRKNLMVGTSR